jgi:hypothetical protein
VTCDLVLSRLDQLIGTLSYRARQTRAKPSSISSSVLSSRVVATTTAFTFSWADPLSLISSSRLQGRTSISLCRKSLCRLVGLR